MAVHSSSPLLLDDLPEGESGPITVLLSIPSQHGGGLGYPQKSSLQSMMYIDRHQLFPHFVTICFLSSRLLPLKGLFGLKLPLLRPCTCFPLFLACPSPHLYQY